MKRQQWLSTPQMIVILAAILWLLVATPMALMAQETPSDGDTVTEDAGDELTDEAPAFNNPAQAAKAQNLAEAYADKPDAALDGYNDAVAEAETGLQGVADEAGLSVDQYADQFNTDDDFRAEQIAAYPDLDLEGMVGAYDKANQDLADYLAEKTTVSVDDIAALRAQGMGWGVIAHELGIHPSALGLGNKNGHQNQVQNQNRNRNKNKERASYGYGKKAGTMSSTMRNLKTGGNAYGKSNGNQGQAADKAGGVGQSSGKSNAAGKSNNGNNGNHGNGNNGNGKGNNKD